MSVYKRQGRNQRPWCYEFREKKVLHKQCGFSTKKEAQAAESEERLLLKRQKTSITFLQAVNNRLDYIKASCQSDHLRTNIARLGKFGEWVDLDISEINTGMIRQRVMDIRYNE